MLKKRRRKGKRNSNKQSHKNYKENIGTKLITNTKKQKLKNLEQRVWNFKNTMLKNKVTKIIKYIYIKFALKIGSFFCKVIVGYKNEN